MLLMIFRRVIRLVFLVIVTVIFADPNYALMQCLQKPFKMLLVVYIFVLSIQGGLTIGAFGQCQWPI